MTMNSINGYSTTRITGLYSGLDTDSLIEQALWVEQAKVDRAYQSKTTAEWTRDAYTEVMNSIGDFTNKFMSTLSEDNIFSENVYKMYDINISSDYDNYFSISGTGDAITSSHTITKSTLAKEATLEGAKYRNRVLGSSGTQNHNSLAQATGTKVLSADSEDVTLKNLTYEDGSEVFSFASDADKLSFSINGETFVFDQDETLQDVMDAVNSNPDANATMQITADNKIQFTSKLKGEDSKLVFANVGGPDSFGTHGGFGITELNTEPKSLIDSTMTLEQVEVATGRNFGFDASGKLSFSVNGETFEFDKSATIQDVMDTVNSSAAEVTMTYDSAEDMFMIRSNNTNTDEKLTFENITGSFFGEDGLTGINEGDVTQHQKITRNGDTIETAAAKNGVDLVLDENGKFSFTVNDVEFSFDTDTTLNEMISTVNGDEEAKATLMYSEITDSFTFASSETGSAASVKVEGAEGVFGGAESFFGIAADAQATGSDAIIEIDGETITQASNTFTLDGISFTLKEDFDAADNAQNLSAAKFSVEQNVDDVVDKVEAFVLEYNELVQSIYEMTNESKDYDYSPLTQAERAEMSEEDIEKWEEEAKKGLLKNDSTLRNLLSDMRSSLFAQVESTGLSAYDLGFSTSSYVAGEYSGQITFDVDKFKAALEKDAEAVANTMANISNSTIEETEYEESGFVTRLFDTMSDVRNTLRGTNIQNANELINEREEEMNDLITQMYEEQESLYMQFAAMEELMAAYQSQSDWLTQQLASM